jgi:tRNA G10  N-methylase Trm11
MFKHIPSPSPHETYETLYYRILYYVKSCLKANGTVVFWTPKWAPTDVGQKETCYILILKTKIICKCCTTYVLI